MVLIYMISLCPSRIRHVHLGQVVTNAFIFRMDGHQRSLQAFGSVRTADTDTSVAFAKSPSLILLSTMQYSCIILRRTHTFLYFTHRWAGRLSFSDRSSSNPRWQASSCPTLAADRRTFGHWSTLDATCTLPYICVRAHTCDTTCKTRIFFPTYRPRI